jgi:hypothetical protein
VTAYIRIPPKPADKAPAEVQPPTSTSKDATR